MNPTIKITDERLEKDIEVAPENVEVTVTVEPIEVSQPPKIVTLKSIDEEINSLQSQIGLMEAELEARRVLIEDKQALRAQVETLVSQRTDITPVEVVVP